ncbi:hypothetical protein Pint_19954 [Pistacia integerrima]|uniref:Uncharacterized protein n=1 Tax=Pistacia integerrima TaxID=434235 RepID=A0ACC0XDI7_9ROSI|nr:hypothetical protein Pint_19954 [Pistacia integerrima]
MLLCRNLRGSDAGIPQEAANTKIPAVVMSNILIDKTGRRPLLVVSNTGNCFCFFLIGLSFYLQDHGYWKEIAPILV